MQLNILLDLVGPILLMLVFFGMYIVHFGGNVVTGRARTRFLKWQWALHELPTGVRRYAHLVHAISILTLVVTGIYIRFPVELLFGDRTIVKYIHYVAAIAGTLSFIAAVFHAFVGKEKAYKEFTFTKLDLTATLPTMKYYAFMASTKPHVANYNPLQKATYGLVVPILMVLQIVTGFALFFSPQMLGWIASAVGGMAVVRVYVRLSHSVISWLFILFLAAHIYLAITEDLPGLLYIFFGIKLLPACDPNKTHQHGSDMHGTPLAGLDSSTEET